MQDQPPLRVMQRDLRNVNTQLIGDRILQIHKRHLLRDLYMPRVLRRVHLCEVHVGTRVRRQRRRHEVLRRNQLPVRSVRNEQLLAVVQTVRMAQVVDLRLIRPHHLAHLCRVHSHLADLHTGLRAEGFRHCGADVPDRRMLRTTAKL